ncbi:hypothetical protein ElyMa_004092900 [Elysia marginata]|uniref:Uncharacterized protein n=1 Tax=Elysia marginata TaxID=1093978 RepID=A0AAV4G9Y2_9GAST|nr:hypothetical protein ElyMa_004092900 [Elysia marginata]
MTVCRLGDPVDMGASLGQVIIATLGSNDGSGNGCNLYFDADDGYYCYNDDDDGGGSGSDGGNGYSDDDDDDDDD